MPIDAIRITFRFSTVDLTNSPLQFHADKGKIKSGHFTTSLVKHLEILKKESFSFIAFTFGMRGLWQRARLKLRSAPGREPNAAMLRLCST